LPGSPLAVKKAPPPEPDLPPPPGPLDMPVVLMPPPPAPKLPPPPAPSKRPLIPRLNFSKLSRSREAGRSAELQDMLPQFSSDSSGSGSRSRSVSEEGSVYSDERSACSDEERSVCSDERSDDRADERAESMLSRSPRPASELSKATRDEEAQAGIEEPFVKPDKGKLIGPPDMSEWTYSRYLAWQQKKILKEACSCGPLNSIHRKLLMVVACLVQVGLVLLFLDSGYVGVEMHHIPLAEEARTVLAISLLLIAVVACCYCACLSHNAIDDSARELKMDGEYSDEELCEFGEVMPEAVPRADFKELLRTLKEHHKTAEEELAVSKVPQRGRIQLRDAPTARVPRAPRPAKSALKRPNVSGGLLGFANKLWRPGLRVVEGSPSPALRKVAFDEKGPAHALRRPVRGGAAGRERPLEGRAAVQAVQASRAAAEAARAARRRDGPATLWP